MTDFVGITDAFVHLPTKQDAFLFDRVGALFLSRRHERTDAATAAEIEWLQQAGVLFDIKEDMLRGLDQRDPEIRSAGDLSTMFALADLVLRKIRVTPSEAWSIASHRALREFLATIPEVGPSNDREAMERRLYKLLHQFIDAHPRLTSQAVDAEALRLRILATSHLSRVIAQHFNVRKGVEAASLLTEHLLTSLQPELPRQSVVVQAVLKSFPQPADDVPWEQILEFRRDEDAAMARRRLRRWIVHIASSGKTGRETVAELEHLIDGYREYMKLHRLKFEHGVVQTIVTTTVGVAENLMKLNWSEAVNRLFELRTRKVALIEAEQKAPGREIAYIVHATDAFASGA